ncbi:MAG: DUF4276 family protein [bacterium]|nr:DUF4276 family protein [bacterium]
MKRVIVAIVEGQSEVNSIPVLLRRILHQLGAYHIEVARPWRVKRNRIVRPGELERAVEQSVRKRDHAAALLVLLDADDDCPAELGPELLARCRKVTLLPAAVAIANRELEGWFLGAKESLRGVRGIRSDAAAPSDPESIRGAKERISRNMAGSSYLEVDDQPALAEQMDLDLAKSRCPSFEWFVREVGRLVSEVGPY